MAECVITFPSYEQLSISEWYNNNIKSSDNSKDNTNTPFSVLEKVREYIFKNLLFVLSTASLLAGGTIFLFYYSEIQYFPNLDFDESVLLLLVAAITGSYTLVISAFVIMSPYIFRGLMFLDQQEPSLSDKEKASDNERAWYFGSIILANLAWLSYFILDYIFKNPWFSFGIPGLIFFGIILGHYRVYSSLYDWIERILQWMKQILLRIMGKLLSQKKDTQKPKNINMFWPWIWSFLFALVISMVIFNSIAVKKEFSENEQFILLGSILLCIIFGNALFAYFQERPKKNLWHWTIPFLTVFFVFFIAGKPVTSQIPKFIMLKFQFGNFTAQQLLLDEKGCIILKRLKPGLDFTNDKATCHLRNIKILSRLGHTFYIETTTH